MSSAMDNNDNDNTAKVVYKTRVVFKVMDITDYLDTDESNRKCLSIDSKMFTIGSDNWFCHIRINNEEMLSYLELSTINKTLLLPIEVKITVSIIDNNNQLFATKENRYLFHMNFRNSIPLVVTIQQLYDNRNRLFDGNVLTVGFDITVIHKKYNVHEMFDTNRYSFRQLFVVKELTDCRLIVGKEDQKSEFFASKLLLSSQSEIFEKIFTTDFIEKKNNEVIIDDIHSDVFEQFLQYLYTGNCDKLYEMCDELLYVADKYMVLSLKTIYFGADEELMKKAKKWIGDNITSVLNQDILKHCTIDSEDVIAVKINIQ
ncbi:speckle-type POZ protein-like [Oppia nitens]|uniref:speckle-type POZ protein-like n=1 Tax=Oppia nitens TaxID=1686743 RepID=UPI0023DCD2AD|nr:speckle-type POZ protein-like [Oppia nitens]